MRTKQELDLLREQAVTLRRQGKSLRQIKQILGPMSNVTLHDALRGVPPPDWTVRPNAKDEQRAKARELRAQGMDYEEIATALGVAKGSVSLWVRDLPRPARLSYSECRKRSAEGTQRYWAAERGVRAARRAAERAAAAAQISDLTDRDFLIAGAIAYWCEGAKSKPHRRSDRVIFTNSDPSLIRIFLRFLEATGGRGREPHLPGPHPRERRCEISRALLAEGHRCAAGAVPHARAEAPQSEDGEEKRRGGLPRLPPH
jgi:transcriptional regulator with XRE-family HTH domain